MLCKHYNRRKRIIFSSSNKHHGEIITAGGCISVLCQQECFPTFFALINKILSLCQPNDQVRNRLLFVYYYGLGRSLLMSMISRENIHSIANVKHEKGGS